MYTQKKKKKTEFQILVLPNHKMKFAMSASEERENGEKKAKNIPTPGLK